MRFLSQQYVTISNAYYQPCQQLWIVSSSSGRNQAHDSSGRNLAQALSRAAVPVSLPIRLPLLLSGKNGGNHLAYRSRYKLQCPTFTAFKSSSAVFPSLDGPVFSIVLKIPLPNFRCLCYNLFHGDVPHFRSFFALANKFYHERRLPAIFICRSAPLGGRSPRLPAARGSLFLPEIFYTNEATLFLD